MRVLKLIGGVVAILALTAIAAAAASAAETLWLWLPGTAGTTYSGKSGKATLEIEKNANAIVCAKSEIKAKGGQITTEKDLGLFTVDFTGCKVGGLIPINSLGDASETILVHVETHDCVILPGDAGILYKPLPLHLEIPATNLLLVVEGSFVGLISPNKKSQKIFTTTIEQEKGKQKIAKCEGGNEESLITSVDGGAFTHSGEGVENGEITFETAAQEIDV